MAKRGFALLGRIAACIAGAGGLPASGMAGTLQVDPVRLEVGAARRTATLRVRNQENAPVTIRAYALSWTQVDGEDRYEETASVIVSPPIFTLAAGATQLIRIGLRPPASGAPAAYRLMVEEVPQATPGGGIQVALRLNLPLFALIEPGNAADLAWSAARGADGRWTIEAANRGRGHVRVEPATAEAATGLDFEAGSHLGVILPGGMRRWTIAADPAVSDAARFASIRRTADAGAPDSARRD